MVAKVVLSGLILVILTGRSLALDIPLRLTIGRDSVSCSLSYRGFYLQANMTGDRILLNEGFRLGAFNFSGYQHFLSGEQQRQGAAVALFLQPRQNLSLRLRYSEYLSGGIRWSLNQNWQISCEVGKKTEFFLSYNTNLGDFFGGILQTEAPEEIPVDWSEW